MGIIAGAIATGDTGEVVTNVSGVARTSFGGNVAGASVTEGVVRTKV